MARCNTCPDAGQKKHARREARRQYSPIGVGIAVHEPAAVVVHIHGPGLVILAQHHVLDHVDPGDAKGRVRVVVVAVHVQLPVMHALGEGCGAQHHPVIVAVAGGSLVVIRQHYVPVS